MKINGKYLLEQWNILTKREDDNTEDLRILVDIIFQKEHELSDDVEYYLVAGHAALFYDGFTKDTKLNKRLFYYEKYLSKKIFPTKIIIYIGELPIYTSKKKNI